MKTSDFYLKPTAKNINESMAKRFGEKLDLETYSIDQLNRAAQLIESKLTVYKNSNFNAPLESEEYHRLTFMRDAVATELNERAVSKSQQQAAGAALAAKRGKGKAKGASKEMMKMSTKELKKFAGTKHKGLPEKKKKVDESMTTMKELADTHAKLYAEAYKKGNLEHALYHKKQCEECGGILSHDAMGECWMTHGGAKPMKVVMVPAAPASGGAGGVTSMMTSEQSKQVDEISAATLGRYRDAAKTSDTSGMSKTKQFRRSEQMPNLAHAKIAAGKSDDDSKYALNRYYMTGAKKVKVPATNEAKKAKPDYIDLDKDGNKKETMKKAAKDAKLKEAAKPDFLDMDKDGNKKETMKKAVADKKKKSVNESYNMIIQHLLFEGEEGKAELVMAVKDMVDKFTSWSEDIATMQATAAMEMADDIRDELGTEQAEAFKQSVSPALDAAFQAVKAAREAMNAQVASMTGGAPAPMGAETPAPDMGSELPAPDMGADIGGEEPAPDMDADMGSEEPMADVGREKRESVERRLRLSRILVGR